MVEAHPLVLRLRSAGLKDLDPCNIDEVHNMWHAFSKAKLCIDGGDRLEYLSWRIYSREVLAIHASRHSSKSSDAVSSGPMGTNTTSSELDDATSSSEDEWETSTEDSSAASDDDDGGDSGEDGEAPALVGTYTSADTRQKPPASQPSLAKLQPSDSCHRMHRKISSLELQNLFSETRTPVTASAKRDSPSTENASGPITAPSGAAMKSCLKKSSSTSPEPIGSVHRARFASPQPVPQYDRYRTSTSASESQTRGASPVVRGFSPSSISVSVGKQSFHDNLARNRSEEDSSDGNEPKVEWPQAERTNSESQKSETRKMFYIGAAESDTDTSSLGSLDGPGRSTHIHFGSRAQDDGAQNSRNAHGRKDVNSPSGNESSLNTADTSDWDDTSDEEEELDDEAKEERRKEMFKERTVPTRPLLKRSLLSSLFVNKVDENASSSADAAVKPRKEPERPSDPQVSAPVDILLGAPLAPHFPLPADHQKLTSDPNGWGVAAAGTDLPSQQPTEHDRRRQSSNGRSFSESSLHITTRPEMYRASTDTRVRRRSSNEQTEQNNWAHQHEDIYDPMNYHSRGW